MLLNYIIEEQFFTDLTHKTSSVEITNAILLPFMANELYLSVF